MLHGVNHRISNPLHLEGNLISIHFILITLPTPRFLPDLLNLIPDPCKGQHAQQSQYRQPQSYPSQNYQTPSPSYKIPDYQTPSPGYKIPGFQTSNQEYQIPDLQTHSSHHNYQQSVEKGYSIQDHKYSVPKQTYSQTSTNQNYFSQNAPHKASVNPPRETIEIVNTDLTSDDYSYVPNGAIQPRGLGQDDLFTPVHIQVATQTKKFAPVSQVRQNKFVQTTAHKAQANNENQRHPKAFNSVSQNRQKVENTFSETAPYKAQPNSEDAKDQRKPKAFTPVTQTRHNIEKVKNTFSQTASYKAEPNAPKGEHRESKQINHNSFFSQTEAHKPEPNKPNGSSRDGKSISGQAKLLIKQDNQLNFQPLPESKKKTDKPSNFLGEFKPVSDSGFAPLPVRTESHFEPSQPIIAARKPKLFGSGIVRFERKA